MNSGSRPPRCCRRSLLVRKVGGTRPCDERAVFTAVGYALTSGCAWRHLPPTFGTSPATAHRRFTVWTEAGLWRRLHRAVLDELGVRGEVDWTSAIVDAASDKIDRHQPDPAQKDLQPPADMPISLDVLIGPLPALTAGP
ncbi:transposase [Streptomyces sp. NPDC001792]|uniref:transposase n=1 Tax=Streptomyces sp. NPDC001792 TaxID=3154524 RepID=UPI00331D333E